MSEHNPFKATPEQIAAKIETDQRIARINEIDVLLKAERDRYTDAVEQARLKVVHYNQDVVEPAKREVLRLIRERKPLEQEFNTLRARYRRWQRKRDKLRGRYMARVSKLAQLIEQKNLKQQQKTLIKTFRQRRRMPLASVFQVHTHQATCESTSIPTESTTPAISPDKV